MIKKNNYALLTLTFLVLLSAMPAVACYEDKETSALKLYRSGKSLIKTGICYSAGLVATEFCRGAILESIKATESFDFAGFCNKSTVQEGVGQVGDLLIPYAKTCVFGVAIAGALCCSANYMLSTIYNYKKAKKKGQNDWFGPRVTFNNYATCGYR